MILALTAASLSPVAAQTSTGTSSRKSPAKATTTTARRTADGQRDVDRQIESLAKQVAEASAEEAAALDRLDDVAARRRQIEGRLAGIDAELAPAEVAFGAATTRLNDIETDLVRSEAKLGVLDADVEAARQRLTDRAVDSYVRQPGTRAVAVAFGLTSFRELAAASGFLRAAADAEDRTLGRYRGLRDQLIEDRGLLVGLRDEATAQRLVVETQRRRLLDAKTAQARVRARAVTEERREKVVLADVRSKVREFEAQIAALKRESDAIGRFLRDRQRGQNPKPVGRGELARPVDAAMTSGFGPRRHPIFGTVRNHTGVDFGATAGTPIRAAADGVVALAGERGGYGNTVVVDHGGALATLYAHQSRIAVSPGAKVSRGQTVGYVGSTGYSTGPHLHFEVRIQGNPVDPMRYL